MHVYTLYTAHNMQCIQMYANVFSIAETNGKKLMYTIVYTSVLLHAEAKAALHATTEKARKT